MPRKKQAPRITNDSTEFGTLIACPLCQWRALDLDRATAWRAAYRHIRDQHDTPHAAKIANQARRNWQRSRENTGNDAP